jgi:transposase
MENSAVEAQLFQRVGRWEPPSRVPIDFPWVHKEMQKAGVTLMLLWSEYVEASRTLVVTVPYAYSQFCDLFACKQGNVDVRQEHLSGEKVIIDYAGKRPCIHDMATGEVMEVELFVGVLSASNYTFAEATRTQTKQDFWCLCLGESKRVLGQEPPPPTTPIDRRIPLAGPVSAPFRMSVCIRERVWQVH